VVDPGVGIPDGRHDLPTDPPEVAVVLHRPHYHLPKNKKYFKGYKNDTIFFKI